MKQNETILITGGSGHIGAHLIEFFKGEGLKVIAPTRSECDLSVSGATKKYLESLEKSGTNLNYIIANAADQSVAKLSDTKPEDVAKMMQINFNAIAEIYTFAAGKNIQSILTISSIEAIRPRPGHLIYGASKAAVEALTRSAAIELSTTRTNALRLGLISRPGIESSWPQGVEAWSKTTPLQRMGSLTDVSSAANFLLNSAWITGEVLTLDGGNSVNPGW